jgi:hypothetical protein
MTAPTAKPTFFFMPVHPTKEFGREPSAIHDKIEVVHLENPSARVFPGA